MKINFAFGLKLITVVLFTVAVVEVGLRFLPTVIPLDLLILFNEQPRAEIAHKRGLPTRTWDTLLLERDDGGPDLRIYTPFTKITWSIKENDTVITAVMDEMGFCNPPQSYYASSIDIITLGDSFTACHAVAPEQTWSSQLAGFTGLSIYNLGRVGVGIFEYLQIFKQFGIQKKPKIVIMNIYEGNDIRDAINYHEYRVQKANSSSEDTFSVSVTAESFRNSWLTQHSYTVNLLLSALIYGYDNFFRPSDPNSVSVNFKYELVFQKGTRISFNPENIDKDEIRTAKKLARLNLDPAVFELVRGALSDFVDLSRRHNFVPVIVYTPSGHTTYAENVVFEDSDLKGLLLSFSHTQREFLKNQSESLGFLFIDLTSSLQVAVRNNGPASLLYYRHDLHLMPLGHTVVASVIEENLQPLLGEDGRPLEFMSVKNLANLVHLRDEQ